MNLIFDWLTYYHDVLWGTELKSHAFWIEAEDEEMRRW